LRCEGLVVEGNPPISETQQEMAVAWTFRRFVERATTAEFDQFAKDRARWAESRTFMELVPA
jgi:hypothetical protein